MCKEEVSQGQQIADNIRKVLLNCDLRIVYAQGEIKLANEEFKLYSKLANSQASKRKALRAKARAEMYKTYCKSVTRVKGEISYGLEVVLSRYTPKYRRIWIMYFIEQAPIEDICREVNYSRPNINVIIKKLRTDLAHHYNGGKLR